MVVVVVGHCGVLDDDDDDDDDEDDVLCHWM